jgi:SAM-dependent methyltransferase
MDQSEIKQKELFDKHAKLFEAHYSDKYTEKFREWFVYKYLVKDLSLAGKTVLDAMGGSGQAADFYLAQGAKLTCLDISEELIESFKKKYPQCDAICASVFENNIPDASFDVVSIVAGLHHLHPKVDFCIDEVFRILKPGGYFIFMEPHAGSLPDFFRKIWYKTDKNYFEENEASVDISELMQKNSGRFEFKLTKYTGFLAFLLVYNSYVFRVPLGLKKYYSPFLLWIDRLINPLQSRWSSCIAVCQWKKK